MQSKISLLLFVLLFGLGFNGFAAGTSQSNVATQVVEISKSEVTLTKKETRKQKLTMKLANKIYKKMEKKAKKKGLAAPKTGFEDIIVLAGAIVTVVGIISIIGNVVSGLIVAGIGLLIYLLGKANGGSLSNVF